MTGQRTNREKALKVKCPICGVEPGEQCTTAPKNTWQHNSHCNASGAGKIESRTMKELTRH